MARFYGNLDIKTLGGAGFASQRTTGENRTWNIDGYDGIQIEVAKSDCTSMVELLRRWLIECTSQEVHVQYQERTSAAGS